jgi:hypothetical protein
MGAISEQTENKSQGDYIGRGDGGRIAARRKALAARAGEKAVAASPDHPAL